MAARSENETLDLIQDVTKLFAHIEEWAAGDFETDVSDILTELAVGDPCDENDAIKRQLEIVIRRVESLYEAGRQLCIAAYPALGRLGSSPDLGNNNLNLDYFQKYCVDNSKEIEKRGFTKDSATTVSGSGSGKATISSSDLNSDIIDVGHVEDMTLRCDKDYSEGARAGAEEFTILGEFGGTYGWEEGGTANDGRSYDYPYGQVDVDFGAGQKRAVSGQRIKSIGGSTAAGNLVRNGDFESPISGTGSTKLPQWTINSGDSDLSQETSDPLFGTYSLLAAGDFEMDHFFSQGRLKPRAFYSISVKLERKSSCDGTLTVKVMDSDEGTTHGTLTQDLTSLSNDTPTLVQPVHFAVPDSAEDLKVQVELASNTTGTVKIDDVVVGPTTLVDGYLISIHDGTTLDSSGYAQGRYKNGDVFTIQTSDTGAGLIQKFFFNIPSGRYIRSATSPTTNWEDPSL